MTRFIDADALIDAMTKFSNATGEDMTHGIFYAHIAPTIDAEPVRHGKWIGYVGTIGNECSVCGKWLDVLQGTAEMNYCPQCGADMRGESDD